MAGTIRLEIDFELWSNSGRDKHQDLTQQGAWLVGAICEALRRLDAGRDDTQVYGVRYFGEVKPTHAGSVIERDLASE